LPLRTNFQIQEALQAAKSNYEALNTHLLDELPTLNSLAREVLVECLAAFVMARKMLSGKMTREYLELIEVLSVNCSKLCGTGPFLRSLQCHGLSRNPLHFMEPTSFIITSL
jgi:hypothetical protein